MNKFIIKLNKNVGEHQLNHFIILEINEVCYGYTKNKNDRLTTNLLKISTRQSFNILL